MHTLSLVLFGVMLALTLGLLIKNFKTIGVEKTVKPTFYAWLADSSIHLLLIASILALIINNNTCN